MWFEDNKTEKETQSKRTKSEKPMKAKQPTNQQSRYLFRKKFRVSLMVFNECSDWRFNDLAKETHTTAKYIKKRYSQFLKRFYGTEKLPQHHISVWTDFIAYENGGEAFNPLESFKEPIYPTK